MIKLRKLCIFCRFLSDYDSFFLNLSWHIRSLTRLYVGTPNEPPKVLRHFLHNITHFLHNITHFLQI